MSQSYALSSLELTMQTTFRTPRIEDFIAWKINGGHVTALTADSYKTELETFQVFLTNEKRRRFGPLINTRLVYFLPKI